MADFICRNQQLEQEMLLSGITGTNEQKKIIVAELILRKETASNDVNFINYLIDKYSLDRAYTKREWKDINRLTINSVFVNKPDCTTTTTVAPTTTTTTTVAPTGITAATTNPGLILNMTVAGVEVYVVDALAAPASGGVPPYTYTIRRSADSGSTLGSDPLLLECADMPNPNGTVVSLDLVTQDSEGNVAFNVFFVTLQDLSFSACP